MNHRILLNYLIFRPKNQIVRINGNILQEPQNMPKSNSFSDDEDLNERIIFSRFKNLKKVKLIQGIRNYFFRNISYIKQQNIIKFSTKR